MGKETNNNELFSFGKDKTVPVEILQQELGELYAHDGNLKRFADAISNIFAYLLIYTEADTEKEIKTDCFYLDELKRFLLNIEQIKTSA